MPAANPGVLTFKQRFKTSRFFKGEPPVSGAIRLTQRRVFILPTARGFAMAFTIVLLLMLGFVYNNNLVYLLGFLLASIFFVAILHTFQALAGLIVEPVQTHPVFAGESAGFMFMIRNQTGTAKPAITAIADLESELNFSLAGHDSRIITLYQRAQHRGLQCIDTVKFVTTYPLGIFRAWSPLRFDFKVLVYPKPGEIAIPFPESDEQLLAGEHQPQLTTPDDFFGIRPYQSGDSMRQIYWKGYAKGLGLNTKQYMSHSGGLEIYLDLARTPGSNVEERVSQLCRWIMDAEKLGLRYGLRISGTNILPDSGEQHYLACLEALALF